MSRWQRGDTMIEVLFAVTIFSMVAVGALTIMNQGSAAAQRSLEVTLVRHEMDGQAEALRTLYDEAMAARMQGSESQATADWSRLSTIGGSGNLAKAMASTFPAAAISGAGCQAPRAAASTGAFVMNAETMRPVALTAANSDTAPVYSQITYSEGITVRGLWVEAEKHTGYVDFHIRACWETLGQEQPVTLGTIVRLYEP